MSFEPKNDRHAIQEVVFLCTFTRSLEKPDIDRVVALHDKWKDELPAMSAIRVFQVMMIGTEPAPGFPNQGEGGVEFKSHRRDGSLEWRMKLEDNLLAINCLTYTRWDDVWARASRLLSNATEPLLNSGHQIKSLSLQYLDSFLWKAPLEGYSVRELFRDDSPYMTTKSWDVGPSWHLNFGTFATDEPFVPASKILNRLHLTGIVRKEQASVVIDSTLRLDLPAPIAIHKELFADEPRKIDSIFGGLHALNKQVLGDCLTEEMKKRIELNA